MWLHWALCLRHFPSNQKQYVHIKGVLIWRKKRFMQCSASINSGCLEKKPIRVVARKRCSKICSKFTGEHPWQSVISIKLHYNFLEITLRHGCSPVNLLHIFRKSFSRNTSEGLLLSLTIYINDLQSVFQNQ